MDINSQHHNLLGNQILSQSEDFAFWRPSWIQNGRHSKPTMDINSQHHNLLEAKFSPNQRIFVFWRAFWIQNGRHSKPTMDIISQHHKLLGNPISYKSVDFCILVDILDSKWPP
jgi:hypothetical protein